MIQKDFLKNTCGHLLTAIELVMKVEKNHLDWATSADIIIWNISTFYYRFDLPQVMRYLKCSAKNIVQELSRELPNNLRPKILRNNEIFEKSQNWVKVEPSTHFLFQKENFGTSAQKLRKNRYKSFLILFTLLDFLTLCYKFCPRL